MWSHLVDDPDVTFQESPPSPGRRDVTQLLRTMRRIEDDREHLDAEAFAAMHEQVRLDRRIEALRLINGGEEAEARALAEERGRFDRLLQETALRREELTHLLNMLEGRLESSLRALGEAPSLVADNAQTLPPLPPDSAIGVGLVQRRAFPRLPTSVHIGLHTENQFFAGLSCDISEGGLFMATDDEIPLGAELDMVIHLPGRRPICASGTVCWRRETDAVDTGARPGVGIRFHKLSAADQTEMEAFIRERDPLLYEGLEGR